VEQNAQGALGPASARREGEIIRNMRFVNALFVAAGVSLAQSPPATPRPPIEQLIDRLPPERIQDRHYQFKEANNLWMPYSLFVPKGYDAARKWPLIVDLHGNGITAVNQIRFQGTTEFAERYGYIVVCPTGYSVRAFWGIPGRGRGLIVGEPGFEVEKDLKTSIAELSELDAMNVLQMVRKEFNIDDNRIFLMGHSMGGAGAYYLAARHPEIWAAVAAISGGGVSDAYAPGEQIKHLPFLVMQGEKDPIVPVKASRDSAAKMKELGMKYEYLEFPGSDHEGYIRHMPEHMLKVFEFFNGLKREK
jgi:predicted peptidase